MTGVAVFPERVVLSGSYVTLEPLNVKHVADLWDVAQNAESSFVYLRYGPFRTRDELAMLIDELAQRRDQPFWSIRDRDTGSVRGWLSLCDIAQRDGTIEIGSIWISPTLQRTRQSTEAMFLLMRYAMDSLGYRRLVWRCCSDNVASVRAAQRLGFVPEGVWRQAVVVKGHVMDISWFSMLKNEWDGRRVAIEAWLRTDNFASDGSAFKSLK